MVRELVLGEIQSRSQAFPGESSQSPAYMSERDGGWNSTGLAWPVASPWVSTLTSLTTGHLLGAGC